jgi:PPE-repeat protein
LDDARDLPHGTNRAGDRHLNFRLLTPKWLNLLVIHLPAFAAGIVIGGAAVSASLGKAGTIGGLSVPQSWATPTPPAIGPETAGIGGEGLGGKAAPATGPAALLRGIPLTGKGRRTRDGYVTKYGFQYSVLAPTPATG